MGLINAVDVTSNLSKNLIKKDTVVCNYKASVIGSIRIYDTSERRIVEDIGFEGSKRSSETPKTRDCSLGHNTKSLIRSASEQSIELSKAKIQNFFLSRGTVLERRAKEKSSIFKVSMGKNNKLQPGFDVEILYGQEGYQTAATYGSTDMTVTAMVGAAGLMPTLAAVEAGKSIALPSVTSMEMHAKSEWRRQQIRMRPTVSAGVGRKGETRKRIDPATRALARSLRWDGWTFARIGEALGISRHSARRALTADL